MSLWLRASNLPNKIKGFGRWFMRDSIFAPLFGYWIDTFNTVNPGSILTYDVSGNVYIIETPTPVTGADRRRVFKLNGFGVKQWEIVFPVAVNLTGGVFSNSNNNLIVFGTNSTGTANFVASINSSGVVQWQKTYGASVTNSSWYNGDVDASGNIFLTGLRDTGINYKNYVIKLSSAGVLLWQKTTGTTLIGLNGCALKLDNNGNPWVLGQNNLTQSQLILMKIDGSNGSLLIAAQVDDQASNPINSYDIVFDSSNNLHMVVDAQYLGPTYIKLNAPTYSATAEYYLQPADSGYSAGLLTYGSKIAVDTSLNAYVSFQSVDATLAKVTPSFSVSWGRRIFDPTLAGFIYPTDIKIANTGAMLWNVQSISIPASFSLPTSGVYTGVYQTLFSYQPLGVTPVFSLGVTVQGPYSESLSTPALTLTNTAYTVTSGTDNPIQTVIP